MVVSSGYDLNVFFASLAMFALSAGLATPVAALSYGLVERPGISFSKAICTGMLPLKESHKEHRESPIEANQPL